MEPFTCIACHIAFATAEQQRDHYKSDWHRYNLKRKSKIIVLSKVASLEPVSEKDFQKKILHDPEQSDTLIKCYACNKTFSSLNSFENHEKSKKHKDLCKKMNSDIKKIYSRPEVREMSLEQMNAKIQKQLDTMVELNPCEDCLFCSHKSNGLQE